MLQIGTKADTGRALTTTAAITDATTGWSTLELQNSDSTPISEAAGGSLTVSNLVVQSVSGVDLSANTTLSLQPHASTTGLGNIFNFVNAGSLNIGTIAGVSGVTTDNGVITITTDIGTLTVNQAISAGSATTTLTVAAAGNGGTA